MDTASHKWYKIGIQLGVPKNKLDEFKKEEDPLSEVIYYWLNGNVKSDQVSLEIIIRALETEHVSERALATKIGTKKVINK